MSPMRGRGTCYLFALGNPSMEHTMDQMKFELGRTVITRNAMGGLHPVDVLQALYRHSRGDWGDLCDEDKQTNEQALKNGGRLFSKYHDRARTAFYVITEWDRSVTTILLPEDY